MPSEKKYDNMSVKELKACIDKAGFSHAGCFEVDELRHRAREADEGRGVKKAKDRAPSPPAESVVRERRGAAAASASTVAHGTTPADETALLDQVLGLVAESGKVRGRDAADILADAEKLRDHIKEAPISEAGRKKMLDSLLDVDKNLAFEKHFEKYCAKFLKFGFLAMTVVPALVTFVEWMVEFAYRPDMAMSPTDLTNMRAVVTGGCGAVGLELAIMLAKNGAGVVISCHGPEARDQDMVEGRLSRMGLLKQPDKVNKAMGWVDIWPLELESFASVREFAGRVTKEMGTVDVLVHSAATKVGCNRTENGHELVTQVNYLSPFLLTHLLIPVLQPRTGRVVYVTCDAGLQRPDWLPWPLRRTQPELMPRIDLEGLKKRQNGNGTNSVAGDCSSLIEYANSKLAIVSHSHELNRYLTGLNKGVSHVINPGHVDSEFGRSDSVSTGKSSMRSSMMGYLPPVLIANKIYSFTIAPMVSSISTRMLRSATAGAKALFHVATAAALLDDEHGGGLFADTAGAFVNCGKPPSECGRVPQEKQPLAATDVELASVLWDRTKSSIGHRNLYPLHGSSSDQASLDTAVEHEIMATMNEADADEDEHQTGTPSMTVKFASEQNEVQEIGFNGEGSMAELLAHYCKYMGIARQSAHFTIWGQEVDMKKSVSETWNTLQLGEDDVIDVRATE